MFRTTIWKAPTPITGGIWVTISTHPSYTIDLILCTTIAYHQISTGEEVVIYRVVNRGCRWLRDPGRINPIWPRMGEMVLKPDRWDSPAIFGSCAAVDPDQYSGCHQEGYGAGDRWQCSDSNGSFY